MSRSSNEPATANAANFLNNFKYEVANELGINNYQTVDKGQLTSDRKSTRLNSSH